MTVNENPSGRGFAAAILAGGRASRYGGVPKGLIEVEPGVSILERTIREIREAGASEIVIVANDPEPYERFGLQIVPDLRRGIGPLGGIEAALAHFGGKCEAVLFLPCDLPGMTSGVISSLLQAFEEMGAPVVFAETELFFEQPLCAVVHNGLYFDIVRLVDEGVRKVADAWMALGAVSVHFDDPWRFFNVNSPEDMQRWRERKQDCA